MITQPPKGMRDFMPEEMLKRNYVINLVKSIFEKYGFLPFETPALEYAEVLEGKYGEDEKLIYKFTDKGGRELALRYDLTVPLCRVIAANPNITRPFKRYHVSRVWRYDRPQKGRYKEFWQCDIDTIGVSSMLADAEIIAIIVDVMEALKFQKYTVKVNNRKLLNDILKYLKIPQEKEKDVFMSIDKFDKISYSGVKEELLARGINNPEKVIELIKINSLEKLEKTIGESQGINELKELFRFLSQMNIKKKYEFAPTLARGLDYYTGTIFETFVDEPKIGALTGGGRYDNLIKKFSGVDMPAVGTTIGVERIIDAMTELNLLNIEKTSVKALVIPIGDTFKESLKIVSQLREKNIPIIIDLAQRNIRKQMEYANKLEIPYVIFIGEDELKKDKVKLKNMKTGEEKLISPASLKI